MLDFDPIEVHDLFDAEFIGVQVPNCSKWQILRDFPATFESISEDRIILPIHYFDDFVQFKAQRNGTSKLYNTFGFPRFTLIVGTGGGVYFLPPGVTTTALIRRCGTVYGMAQLIHPDNDLFEGMIEVPVKYCPTTATTAMSARCFQTIRKNKGFYDPALPYIAVKMYTNRFVADFITKGIKS